MIIAIRIAGQVNIPKDIKEALFRIRLRKKYSAVLLNHDTYTSKLLRNLRDYIAYGSINEETLLALIEKRAKSLDNKKINSKEIVSHLGKKSLEDLGIKPFFSLHPPRGGIDAKKHFGVNKGVLGDNKENINNLVGRML